MDIDRNQHTGQMMRKRLAKMVVLMQSVMRTDWTISKCSDANGEGIPARYYQGNKMQNPCEYNSTLLRGLCSSPLGQISTLGTAQRAFNQRGAAEDIWLKYLYMPQEHKVEQASSADRKCVWCNSEEDNDDGECEMEDAWHIHDLYNQTVSTGHQRPSPMANDQED